MVTLGTYEVHPAADIFPLIGDEELAALADDIKHQGLQEPIKITADGKTLVDGRNRYRACDLLNIEPLYEKLPAYYTEKDILDYIVSANVRRRHMNAGQLAFAALALEPMYAAAAKERQREAGANYGENHPKQEVVADLPQPLYSPDESDGDWYCQGGGHAVASSVPSVQAGSRLCCPQCAEDWRPEQNKSREQAAKAVGAKGRTVSQAKAVERDAPDLAEKVKAGEMALDAADRERKKREAAKPKIADPAPKPSRTMLTLFTHDGQPVQYPQPQSAATFNETPGDGISWASWSWNPVTGCLHGCDYCYARDIATSRRFADAYPVGFTPLFHHERLEAPANTIIPRRILDSGDEKLIEEYKRVFVCSMADLYGRWVPDEWIAKVHASMLASPQWQYILLTKFPARYVGLELPAGAWVGTSVDEQKRVRIAENAFRELPDNVIKWLSLEPLREPLEFDDLSMFDWVVIGAQTATTQPDGFHPAVAPDFDWVVDIYQKAREAGCKVHFKPNIMDGKPGMRFPDEYPSGR